MKKLFQVEAGRYWLLIICFLLLAATLFLIYQHPSDRVKDLKTDDYEKNTLDKWYSQAEFLLKRGDWDQAKNLALKNFTQFAGKSFRSKSNGQSIRGKRQFGKSR